MTGSLVPLGVMLVWIAVSGCAFGPRGPSGADTLVLTGGRVWTGDPDRPEVEAVLIRGDRILAVGSTDEIESLAGPEALQIDLEGRRVVPGLTDAHVHFLQGGDELLAPDLRSAPSEEEFARRLGAAAAKVPPGTWLVAGAWDHENWPGTLLPRRETLDRYTPEHPVFVSRLDGHMAVANSLAIRIAGVSAETPDPEGGEIVRDPDTGEPAGVFKDAALSLVSRHVPEWDEHARRDRARVAIAHAVSLGVTGVHEMGTSAAALRTYQDLLESGELTVRISAYAPMASLDDWRAVGVRRGFGGDLLKVNGLKAFADGSLGSSTALFLEPYVGGGGEPHAGDTEPEYGLAQMDLSEGGELEREVRAAHQGGLQLAIHAIGDRAMREVLDLYERTAGDEIPRSDRPRIEHSQHIHPDDLGRFAALGVIASMQPSHAADDGRWAAKRIGEARCDTTYAFRDLLDRGAMLAFGSDWPVAPLSPLRGIEAAVTRQTLDGKHPQGWIPRQKISVEEALRAYTVGAAYAGFDDGRLGRIRPGYLADLVVLSEDILEIEPERIGEVAVDLTIVDGRVVYERGR